MKIHTLDTIIFYLTHVHWLAGDDKPYSEEIMSRRFYLCTYLFEQGI